MTHGIKITVVHGAWSLTRRSAGRPAHPALQRALNHLKFTACSPTVRLVHRRCRPVISVMRPAALAGFLADVTCGYGTGSDTAATSVSPPRAKGTLPWRVDSPL